MDTGWISKFSPNIEFKTLNKIKNDTFYSIHFTQRLTPMKKTQRGQLVLLNIRVAGETIR